MFIEYENERIEDNSFEFDEVITETENSIETNTQSEIVILTILNLSDNQNDAEEHIEIDQIQEQ